MSPLTANIFLLAYSVYFANISYASQNFASVRSMLCKVQYELVALPTPMPELLYLYYCGIHITIEERLIGPPSIMHPPPKQSIHWQSAQQRKSELEIEHDNERLQLAQR